MSVSGILSSNFFNYHAQSVQNNVQQFQKEFQQLGQDLQSGNLAAAQSDFATLQQNGPQPTSTASSQNSSPIAQAFKQLANDLQSANISAAQKDYATIGQDLQSQAPHGHHHRHGGGGQAGGGEISQLLGQLGQDLQSGNLTSAQQAYNTLAQDFQQSTSASGTQPQSPLVPLATNVSVSA